MQLVRSNLIRSSLFPLSRTRFTSSPVPVCTHLKSLPTKGKNVFIAPNAIVIGDVKIGDNSSVFYGCVLRGDINSISIGDNSNIQDNTVMHVSTPTPCIVKDNVTVGHNAILHACTIESNCLIGMGAIVMDEAVVNSWSIVAAGALIPQGKQFPPNSLLVGSPAKRVRDINESEKEMIQKSATKYVETAKEHLLYFHQKVEK